MYWKKRKVLVTGGTSFIGSHLVDLLVEAGANVRVVDDLTSGKIANIEHYVKKAKVQFVKMDLLKPGSCDRAVKGMDTVFHLAAIHGGRGYVDLHQALCAQNLAMDGMLIKASHEAGVEKFVFASSGCVYPKLQTNQRQRNSLFNRRNGWPALCRRQYVRLGKADDRNDFESLSPGFRHEIGLATLFHGVRGAGP